MEEEIELRELTPLPVPNPAAELPGRENVASAKVSLRVRVAVLTAVITPFFGLIAAITSTATTLKTRIRPIIRATAYWA